MNKSPLNVDYSARQYFVYASAYRRSTGDREGAVRSIVGLRLHVAVNTLRPSFVLSAKRLLQEGAKLEEEFLQSVASQRASPMIAPCKPSTKK